ncbi:MAG: PAS domain-containing sensor histidine kinase [Oceanicaulis sp.]
MIRQREASGGGVRRSAPAGESRPRTLGARGVIVLVGLFALVFGAVIFIKLQTESGEAARSAAASSALTANFVATGVESRLREVGGALSMAGAQLEGLDGAPLTAAGQAAVRRLEALPSVSAAALLYPDGRIETAGGVEAQTFRAAADAALASPQGVAALAHDEAPLAAAAPAPLGDGSVGALVAILDPDALLGMSTAGEVAMLTDAQGRLLAIRPQANFTGAPLAVERFNLDPALVAATAERGGAVKGGDLAGTPKLLGAAAVAGAPLHALSLGPVGMDAATRNRTWLFHLLIFLAPLGAAVALSALLRNQMSQLGDTQLRLSDSESRFRIAIEGARCGVWDWDLETDDVVLTESFAQLIGRSGAEGLSGPELLLLFREEDRARVRAALRGAANAKDVDVEVRAAQLPVWLQLRGRIKPGTRRIVGVAIDITERKGAQARVAAAESRLRAALESMTESFVLWDARKRLVLWNRKFREFFGFGDGVLRPGMSYAEVEAAAGRAIARVHGGEDGAEAYDLELADGRWLHYSERRTADGGLVSVGADITELKAQEGALKDNDRKMRRTVENLRLSQERIQELAGNYEQEKIRAEEANRSKSEFLANMSHELRTPLNAINGFSEIMAGEMFGPLGHERYKDYVADILSSGQHLLSLINDILDMSKIEAGKMQLQPEPVEPAELIEQCVRIMRARAEEKQIRLTVEGGELPTVEADPRAIKQVLLNLMSNAVKFTPEGGSVTVRGFDAADGVVLQVADSGIGIAEADLPRLGRPFEQIESQHSKKHAGSGLGLALSKSLVEMHGGTLRIDSVEGKGTTVSFSLPREARLPEGHDSQPASREPAALH